MSERPLPTFALSRHRLGPALVALLLGVLCTIAPHLDRTLGRPLRAHGADLALAMFLFLGAGALTTISARFRAIAVLVLLCGIELSQLARSPGRSGVFVDLTVGATFDWVDLIAFCAGVAIAIFVEDRVDRRARLAR